MRLTGILCFSHKNGLCAIRLIINDQWQSDLIKTPCFTELNVDIRKTGDYLPITEPIRQVEVLYDKTASYSRSKKIIGLQFFGAWNEETKEFKHIASHPNFLEKAKKRASFRSVKQKIPDG